MAGQLTLRERVLIARLRRKHASQKEMAYALGRSPSTICRELHRNGAGNEYDAARAQYESERRRRKRPLVPKIADPRINQRVRSGLAQEWSPAQIAGRMKQQNEPSVSAQTIYAWIKRDRDSNHWRMLLRRRDRRPWHLRSASTAWKGAGIRGRPMVVETRSRLGDFEGDTVLGPAGTGGLATIVCRKSRFSIITQIRTKDAESMCDTIKQRLASLDRQRCHSITFDNGGEFAHCRRLETQLGITVYFADPGCPYQRGTNENTNGLIRHYFPKGTDFRNISHHEVRRVEELLNTRPRACLGFRTPAEVFYATGPPSNCD